MRSKPGSGKPSPRMAEPPSAVAARVRRVLPAPPERVFAEWVDREAITSWMCPYPARCLRAELEPWVGGRLRFDIEDAGVEFFVAGEFTELDRPRRLSFTWHCSTWPDPSADSLVVVSLDLHPDRQTLMTIEHFLLPAGLTDQHQAGWIAIAGQLAAFVAT